MILINIINKNLTLIIVVCSWTQKFGSSVPPITK